jgi:hypothetical protein
VPTRAPAREGGQLWPATSPGQWAPARSRRRRWAVPQPVEDCDVAPLGSLPAAGVRRRPADVILMSPLGIIFCIQYLLHPSSKVGKLYVHFDRLNEPVTMVQSILAFETVCDHDIFYTIIAHIYLQPNIQQNLWNSLDQSPIAMLHTFMEWLLCEVDSQK